MIKIIFLIKKKKNLLKENEKKAKIVHNFILK